MKIVFAADGSSFTKKALAHLVTHQAGWAHDTEAVVVHVQPPLPDPIKRTLGKADALAFYAEESEKVLRPIRRFLDRHGWRYRCEPLVGAPAKEIVRIAREERADLVVMGTHGHSWLGAAVMGSVAQRVVAESDVPVLLVK